MLGVLKPVFGDPKDIEAQLDKHNFSINDIKVQKVSSKSYRI